MPKVSVVIPAHNAGRYISQCLKSVFAQTLEDFEVVLVDDGSTDDTVAIAERVAPIDRRLHIIRQENMHAGIARNVGMRETSGEYLYFLDADDYIDSSALEKFVGHADRFHADVVACRSVSIDVETGCCAPIDYVLNAVPFGVPLESGDLERIVFQQFMGWPWDKLFRRSYVEREGLKFQGLRTSNDAWFVFLALALSNATICIEDALVFHRINNSSSLEGSREKSWDNALCAALSIQEELGRRGIYERFARSYENWVANFIRWNLATLAPDSAKKLFDCSQGLLGSLPEDAGYYYDRRDWSIVKLASMQEDERLSAAVRLIDEASELSARCERAEQRIADLEKCLHDAEERLERVYASRSYRLGNALLKPAARLMHENR